MRMCNFWAQNGPFPQMRIFSENLLTSIDSFIHAYLHAKNQSQILINSEILTVKYWNLVGREPCLVITWEPHFSQACRFCRMLMNHMNFHFTKIPDKTNDVISFKKVQKPCFWGIFDHFWSFLPDGNFFQRIRLCHTQLYMGP